VTRLVGERNLEDAPIPLAIGTTDIRTGRTVVLQHGPVADAVRASAAIPGLFRPIELDGRLLVDGGLTDNLISASLVATGADVIVGVDVIAHAAKYADPKRYTDVLSNTFNIFVHRMNTASRDHFDVLIDPDVGRFQITDLSKGADLIEAGYRAAKAAHARIDAAIAAKTRRPWWRPRWHRAAP
jgi:NTE family protein